MINMCKKARTRQFAIIIVLLLMTFILLPVNCHAAKISAKWKRAYYNYLSKNISNKNTTFGLFYVNRDTIPELAVGFNGTGRYEQVHLFTYYNGKVRDLGYVGRFSSFSYLQKRNLINNSIPQGPFKAYIKAQKIIKGRLKTVYEFEINDLNNTYRMGKPGKLFSCSRKKLDKKMASLFPSSKLRHTPDVMLTDKKIYRCNKSDLKLILTNPSRVTYSIKSKK